MTRPGIEIQSPGQSVNTLPTGLLGGLFIQWVECSPMARETGVESTAVTNFTYLLILRLNLVRLAFKNK